MSRISMKAIHRLGKEEAQRRLKGRLRAVPDDFRRKATHLHEEWSDGTLSFTFEALGARIAGTMVVGDRDVYLAADVPRRIAIFKRLIEKRLRAELGDLLSKK